MSQSVFNHQLNAKNRTYFLDCKKTQANEFYLTITESKRTDIGYERHSIMVFEEHLDDLIAELQKVNNEIKNLKIPIPKNKFSIDAVKETFPNAYNPWTKEDDENLEVLFCEGKSVAELSKIFKRNGGGINARIEKLELVEKYK